MKLIITTILSVALLLPCLNCRAAKRNKSKDRIVYQSRELKITQIAENSFVHITYLQTNDFGKVPCNGLIVSNSNEAIIFDTPADNKGSEELMNWVKDSLHCKIKAIVPTHFHNDCLGGLKAFEEQNIPSYAYFKTIELAQKNDYVVPQNSFSDSIVLKVGNEPVIIRFLGEGHTKDNVVAYFPGENVLFGGCLIKEINAGKGYLGDANIDAWSATVEKVKKEYPDVKIIVPGHGAYGNKKLLDYTIKLFKKK